MGPPTHAPAAAPAETNAGEMEVRDALQAKADHLAGTGDHAAALAAYAAVEGKTAGTGPKMDLVFSQLRCAGAGVQRWQSAALVQRSAGGMQRGEGWLA